MNGRAGSARLLGCSLAALVLVFGCELDRTPQGTTEPAIRRPADPPQPGVDSGDPGPSEPGPMTPPPGPDGGGSDPTPGPPPCTCEDPDCDLPECDVAKPDGADCASNGECESSHCQAGRCCADGLCCAADSDCGGGAEMLLCEAHTSCQGASGRATCVDFRCTIDGPSVDDDSACDDTIEASDCGPYPSVYCNGAADQKTPACADSCGDDRDCDPGAHCEEGECQPDRDDGSFCDNDGQCLSFHCDNGLCCGTGNCCRAASDCPSSFGAAPRCDDPTTCQGSRVDAVCEGFQCAPGPSVDDDSACDTGTMALQCDGSRDIFCNGRPAQQEPTCNPLCFSDSVCDPGFHCNFLAGCVADLDDGAQCFSSNECRSGHCQNGYCCGSGDCCRAHRDCSRFDVPSNCDDPRQCQGHREEGFCGADFRCAPRDVADDSGCSGALAAMCAPYAPARLMCSSAVSQVAPVCRTGCANNNQCSGTNVCRNGQCGPECTAQMPCTAPDVCVNQRCVPQCAEDSDCPGPQVCRGGSCEPECTNNTDCTSPEICRSNVCELECSAQVPCTGEGQTCENNRCVCDDMACSPYRCGANNTCPSACTDDSACGPQFTCVGGACVPPCDVATCGGYACGPNEQCLTSCDGAAGCASGYACVGGNCVTACDPDACVPFACDGATQQCADACNAETDAGCADGNVCVGGTACVAPCVPSTCSPYVCSDDESCTTSCTNATGCVMGFVCTEGQCVPPVPPPGPAD